MKKVLVYLISPIHVVSSIAAVRTLHAQVLPEVSFFVHWPGLDTKVVEEIGRIIKHISGSFSFISNTCTMSSEEKENLIGNKDPKEIIRDLKARIGDGYHELYYAHDIECGMFRLLAAAFPRAKRICYGDAFGNVYEKHVHLGFLQQTPQDNGVSATKAGIGERLCRSLRKVFSYPHIKGPAPMVQFAPHTAALILPVDQSGNFLKNINLVVCKKNVVLDVLQACISVATQLQQYIKELLQEYEKQKKYILLTDNIAEGTFIEFAKEVEMYCSMVKEHCDPGSVIFLKSHPGETLPRNQKIKEQLSDDFVVEELDREFKRYPIEMWKPLITQSTVICLSYPVLSLKYLYGVDVIQPMDDAFIEKWFPEWTWASYKNAVTLYMEPLKRLAQWDGQGVLWAGSIAKP